MCLDIESISEDKKQPLTLEELKKLLQGPGQQPGPMRSIFPFSRLRETSSACKREEGNPERPIHPKPENEGGIPKGALTEVSGPLGGGKTQWVLDFLGENPELRVAWVEREFEFYPNVVQEREREMIFLETGDFKKEQWALQQLLRSGSFDVIVHSKDEATQRESEGERERETQKERQTEIELRRLQLASEKSQSSLIMITDRPRKKENWPIFLQVWVDLQKAKVLKNRERSRTHYVEKVI